MKQIGVISLETIHNAGDEILGTCTDWLLCSCGGRVKKIELDPPLCAAQKSMTGFDHAVYGFYRALCAADHRILRKIGISERYRWKSRFVFAKLKKYFREQLSDVDAVVLAVGMLKYINQNHSFLITTIVREAERRKIPVFMSAMSIADPNEKDFRYHQLVAAVNSPAVWAITTRDGQAGVEKLNRYYVQNQRLHRDFVGDPALWIPECYGIRRGEHSRIGIGLLNTRNFKTYGKQKTPEEVLNFYIETILELEARGEDWVMFCNGMRADYEVGLELLEKLKLPPEKLLRRPTNARELIEDIAGFDVILGGRLHACITAVSLGVPVVGLLWDDKLLHFAQTMNISEFFLNEQHMNGKNAADLLQRAKNYTIDTKNRDSYKEKTLLTLNAFVNILEGKKTELWD